MKTPLTELLEWVHSLGINPSSKEFDHAKDLVIEKINALLPKEKEVITKAVNDTIDAYHFYVENPYNPPPMNGNDYFNQTFNTEE